MEETNGHSSSNSSAAISYDKRRSRILVMILTAVLSSILVTLSALDTRGLFSFFLIGTASAVLSFGLLTTRSIMVLVSVPISALASFLITLDAYTMFGALIFAVSGIALTYAVYRRKSRTETIITVSSAVIYISVIHAAVTILLGSETFGIEAIKAYLSEILEPLRIILENTSVVNKDGEIIYFYTSEQVQLIVNYAMTLLPSIVICATNLFAYFTSAVLLFAMKRFGIARKLYAKGERSWSLRLSSVSAIVFAVSYLISVLFRSDMIGAVQIVTLNLLIILTPGFALTGFRDVVRRINANTENGYSPFYIVGLVVLIVINAAACTLLLAFFGVIVTLISSYRIRQGDN